MSKKDTDFNDDHEFDADDDFALFQDAVKGVKKFSQDTIIQQPNRNPKQKEIAVAHVKRATTTSIFQMSLFGIER